MMISQRSLSLATAAAMRHSSKLGRQCRTLGTSTAAATRVTNANANRHRLLHVALAGAAGATVLATVTTNNNTSAPAGCEMNKGGGDVVMLAPTKEPATGILFTRLCNGMQFVGCGVRVKWGFVKVYAAGTYVDPIAMAAIKKEGAKATEKALLDPMYPRTIRSVMNRSLSIDKYTAAIIEALEPRVKGEDLEKLDEFKKLNPPVDLIEGAEMEMTIRGDTLLYKNSAGGVGAITSAVFCRAMCDVYYGADAVSPTHKEEVVKGIQAL